MKRDIILGLLLVECAMIILAFFFIVSSIFDNGLNELNLMSLLFACILFLNAGLTIAIAREMK